MADPHPIWEIITRKSRTCNYKKTGEKNLPVIWLNHNSGCHQGPDLTILVI
jgi:hypothetical protein